MFKEISQLAMFRLLKPSDAFLKRKKKKRDWIEISPQKEIPLAKSIALVKCGNIACVAPWVLK